MTLDLLTITPRVHHRLAVALQFIDAFSEQPVRAKLAVRIPDLELEAIRVEHDATYRFLLAEAPAPDLFEVTVNADRGDYVSHEPIEVELPRTPASPLEVTRADYLVSVPLWPTARLRVPHSETAVVGRISSEGVVSPSGLKVVLHTPAEDPALVPYARTDDNGDFLYRLLRLRATETDPDTQTVSVKVFGPGDVPITPVTPDSLDVTLGRVGYQTFIIP